MAPIPLSKVQTFRSYGGLFWLCIECRKCGRRSEITAEAFVADAVKRLVCEHCKAKNPIVLVGMKR